MIAAKSLFLRQSALDAWEAYQSSLTKGGAVCWDTVIITASNENQRKAYEIQLDERRSRGWLPEQTDFLVIPDPDGQRVGSGGATLNALLLLKERYQSLGGKRILIIHSGGDSKRVPSYSACGKLFSPVPRILPGGMRSTLFDEFLISMSAVSGRVSPGLMVCSGDVLLQFNPLQLDFYGKGAAAFSFKEDAETGKDHGVYLRDEEGNVGAFLHKLPVSELTSRGAVDARGQVDIDTGAVFIDMGIVEELCALCEAPGNRELMISARSRVSFYADFLYPLASGSTLEQFYQEKAEGENTEELKRCRTLLWNALHKYRMKLCRFSPAAFIHFGTSREMLALMTDKIGEYSFLDWSARINACGEGRCTASNSLIEDGAKVGDGSYIEDSVIKDGARVGLCCMVSGVTLPRGAQVPPGCVLHGLKLTDGRFTARFFSVDDNPKENGWMGEKLDQSLWSAPLFPVRETIEEAVRAALNQSREEPLISLEEGFQKADVAAILAWQNKLTDRVRVAKFLKALDAGECAQNVSALFLSGASERALGWLREAAESSDTLRKARVYYYISRLAPGGEDAGKCFTAIRDAVLRGALRGAAYNDELRIVKDSAFARLPVRANFGGGWSDTPPHCIEHGGAVLNAALSLEGRLPVEVEITRASERAIILSSGDNGSYGAFTDIKQLQDCHHPGDPFSLHKAGLIACGVIPYQGDVKLSDIITRLGGGFRLDTRVTGVPRGSGLGTSSILAGACVKALYEFTGQETTDNNLYNRVLCMEQIMSTGGGWQDQVGGLAPGIKMITSAPGLEQKIVCTQVRMTSEALKELNDRYCLIYTGQRRLARNLLREVVGRYIGNKPETLDTMKKIQRLAALMRFELEMGNIDGFAQLLSEHWELSKILDSGCTNTCIEQLFLNVADMIDGRMICGAGGGGFLQVILKKGVTRQDLRARVNAVFADSGADVWECKILGD